MRVYKDLLTAFSNSLRFLFYLALLFLGVVFRALGTLFPPFTEHD